MSGGSVTLVSTVKDFYFSLSSNFFDFFQENGTDLLTARPEFSDLPNFLQSQLCKQKFSNIIVIFTVTDFKKNLGILTMS